jgi:hypothetical protein
VRARTFGALFSAIVVIVDLNDLETSMVSFEHIAQRLAPGPSVPSIGGSKAQTLDAALARVARAERELQDARSEARRLGRLAGKKLSTLFEDSIFVKRSSAEEWMEESHSAGYDQACEHFRKSFRPTNEKPFVHIAKRMVGETALPPRYRWNDERMGIAPSPPRHADPEPPPSAADLVQEQIRAARQPDLSSNTQIGAATSPDKLADQILSAAKRAKSPTDADPPRATNPLSEEILKQGRRRRGELP